MFLTAEELRELLDAPGGARERIATYLLVYTAARADEIRRVRWSDVDLEALFFELTRPEEGR